MSMKIQATIAGFAGQPITLVAVLDEHTGVLVVAKEVKYREERIAPDFALISNLDLPDLDFSYTDALMRDSIRAYYTRKAQQMLDLNGDLQRHEPDARIELDKGTKAAATTVLRVIFKTAKSLYWGLSLL